MLTEIKGSSLKDVSPEDLRGKSEEEVFEMLRDLNPNLEEANNFQRREDFPSIMTEGWSGVEVARLCRAFGRYGMDQIYPKNGSLE